MIINSIQKQKCPQNCCENVGNLNHKTNAQKATDRQKPNCGKSVKKYPPKQ